MYEPGQSPHIYLREEEYLLSAIRDEDIERYVILLQATTRDRDNIGQILQCVSTFKDEALHWVVFEFRDLHSNVLKSGDFLGGSLLNGQGHGKVVCLQFFPSHTINELNHNELSEGSRKFQPITWKWRWLMVANAPRLLYPTRKNGFAASTAM